jgi:hypothetical protein
MTSKSRGDECTEPGDGRAPFDDADDGSPVVSANSERAVSKRRAL